MIRFEGFEVPRIALPHMNLSTDHVTGSNTAIGLAGPLDKFRGGYSGNRGEKRFKILRTKMIINFIDF